MCDLKNFYCDKKKKKKKKKNFIVQKFYCASENENEINMKFKMKCIIKMKCYKKVGSYSL